MRSGRAYSATTSRPGRTVSVPSLHGASGEPTPSVKTTWRDSPGASSMRACSDAHALSPTVSLPEHSPRSTARGADCVRYGPRNTSRSVSNDATSAPESANQHSLKASRVELRRWMNPSR